MQTPSKQLMVSFPMPTASNMPLLILPNKIPLQVPRLPRSGYFGVLQGNFTAFSSAHRRLTDGLPSLIFALTAEMSPQLNRLKTTNHK